jgi:hypothetical protein
VHKRAARRTNAQLLEWLRPLFQQFNSHFFSNRLPEYEVRVEALIAGKTLILFRDGKYHRLPEGNDLHGLCLAEEQRIYIDSRCSELNDEFVREVLLHEMCHASIWQNASGVPSDSHGPEFIAELRRLVAVGEAWAIDQAEYYGTIPPSEQAELPLDVWRAHRDTKTKTG